MRCPDFRPSTPPQQVQPRPRDERWRQQGSSGIRISFESEKKDKKALGPNFATR